MAALLSRISAITWQQIYSLVGRQPLGFFLVNLVVFLVIIASVIGLVRSLGGNRWQAWFSGLIFALSGPVIENTYTLSKAELMQMALLLASLLIFARLAHAQHPHEGRGPCGVPNRIHAPLRITFNSHLIPIRVYLRPHLHLRQVQVSAVSLFLVAHDVRPAIRVSQNWFHVIIFS